MIETLYTPSPDYSCGSYQSISAHPNQTDDRGGYNKWIVILQEFDIEFVSKKLKKLLIFAELMSNFPSLDKVEAHEDSFVDDHIFLISSLDPWYGDIIVDL